MKSPIFSLIIPIYNGSSYIDNLLTLSNYFNNKILEIILINDGSSDNTLKLLNENFTNFKNIRIINNNKNIGLGLSRNKGLRLAKGEFVMFLDVDDKFLLSDLEYIYNNFKKLSSDFYIFDYEFLSTGRDEKILYDEIINTNLLQYPKLINCFPCWSAIYKKSFLAENQIIFSARRKYEDLDFTLQCIVQSKKISVINKKIVEYNKLNSSSMTSNLLHEDVKYFNDHFRSVIEILKQKKLPRSLIIEKYVFYFSRFINQYFSSNKHNHEITNKNFNYFKKKFLDIGLSLEEFYNVAKKGILWNYNFPNIVFNYYLFLTYDLDKFSIKVSNRVIERNDYFKFINTNEWCKNYLQDLFENNNLKINEKYKIRINFGNIKNVNIHIGYTKTASSFIQSHILKNYSILLKNKCLYPKSFMRKDPENPNHNLFTNYFKRDVFNKDESALIDFQKEINSNSSCDNLLISAENFYLHDQQSLEELINFFPQDLNITFFIVTRNLAEWLDSSYKERLRSSSFFGSMNSYIELLERQGIIPYSKKLELFSKLVNKYGNVKLREFTYDSNLKFIDTFFKNFLFSVNININKKNIIRSSDTFNYNDYISLNLFNLINRKLPFFIKQENKKKFLRITRAAKNYEENNKLPFTFISKGMLNHYSVFQDPKVYSKSVKYLKNKTFINSSIEIDPIFFNIPGKSNNPFKSDIFLNFIPRIIVGTINFLLSNELMYKYTYACFNRVSHLNIIKKLLSIYKKYK